MKVERTRLALASASAMVQRTDSATRVNASPDLARREPDEHDHRHREEEEDEDEVPTPRETAGGNAPTRLLNITA